MSMHFYVFYRYQTSLCHKLQCKGDYKFMYLIYIQNLAGNFPKDFILF